ncbi:HAD-IIB family hydrolase [bacterium]|nr:MAG: HAD-IIB family hydrolase [bacterium]
MTPINKKLVIFTDLDGTLLDSRYSWKKAASSLKLIQQKSIPLIFCSSKTRAEIELLRKKLNNKHPFISENGGGIFIPKSYFPFQIPESGFNKHKERNYIIIRLGAPYHDLRKALSGLRAKGFGVRGFGDMSIRELCDLTGLNPSGAKLAKQREFDEPFVFKGSITSLKTLKQSIKSMGLSYTQGELFHLMGRSDKGRAVEILNRLYRKHHKKIVSVALGDSPNDLEMLRTVDQPIVVQKSDGSYDKRLRVKGAIKAEGKGPEGWNRAVTKLLSQ